MINRAVALGLAALAAGCASLPPPAPPAAEVQARRAVLQTLDRWDLRGRVAVRLPDEGAQVNLHWRHARDHEQLDLTGPFGGGHAQLRFDANGAVLRDARGREYEGGDPEALLYRAIGWQVPLAGLGYWIRGLPVPDVTASEELDERGRLRVLRQLGWDIQFLAYTLIDETELPSRLFLVRRLPATVGTDDPRIEVRVVVSEWTLAR